jgi:hypothetical protein
MEGRDLSLQRSDGKRQAYTASVSRSFVLVPIFASAGTVPAVGCRWTWRGRRLTLIDFRPVVRLVAYINHDRCNP